MLVEYMLAGQDFDMISFLEFFQADGALRAIGVVEVIRIHHNRVHLSNGQTSLETLKYSHQKREKVQESYRRPKYNGKLEKRNKHVPKGRYCQDFLPSRIHYNQQLRWRAVLMQIGLKHRSGGVRDKDTRNRKLHITTIQYTHIPIRFRTHLYQFVILKGRWEGVHNNSCNSSWWFNLPLVAKVAIRTLATFVSNEHLLGPPRIARTIAPVWLLFKGVQASKGSLSSRYPTIEVFSYCLPNRACVWENTSSIEEMAMSAKLRFTIKSKRIK